MASGDDHILSFYDKNKSFNKMLTKQLIKSATKFAYMKFGLEMCKKINLFLVAQAMCNAFPLEFANTSALIAQNGRQGILYEAARYFKDVKRRSSGDLPIAKKKKLSQDEAQPELSDDPNMEEKIKRLQGLCHNEQVQILNLLRSTFDYRQKLLNNSEKKYQNELIFNFFIVQPAYLNEEFNLHFPTKQSKLYQEWPKLEVVVDAVAREYSKNLPGKKIIVPHDERPFLSLLQLIGTKQQGRRKNNEVRENFCTSWSRLIECHNVNTPPETIKTNTLNRQPFLVALISTNRTEVTQYMIILQPKVIALDPDVKFSAAFDILFKIYKVFNLEVPHSLQNFFNFFEEFIFEIQQFDIPRNKRIYDKIKKASTNQLLNEIDIVEIAGMNQENNQEEVEAEPQASSTEQLPPEAEETLQN